MNLETLVATYGYLAVFLGAVFEGEMILILGGFAVHEGLLDLYPVLLFAFLGAVIGDFAWFTLGRSKGHILVNKYPWMKRLARRPQTLIHKKPKLVALFVRFLYGFRSIVPFSLGMSSIKTGDFLLYNAMGAMAWTTIIGTAGYFFGEMLEGLIGNIRHYEFRIIVIVMIVLAVAHSISRLLKAVLKKYVKEYGE